MPIIGTQPDRLADLLEELVDKLDEQNNRPPPEIKVPAPVVNVAASPPAINVAAPSPIVNVPTHKLQTWTFSVIRNSQGLIETIAATPKL